MKIDLEKLNPTARRMANKALEQQARYERVIEMRKKMTLEEIGAELKITKQAVAAIIAGGST